MNLIHFLELKYLTLLISHVIHEINHSSLRCFVLQHLVAPKFRIYDFSTTLSKCVLPINLHTSVHNSKTHRTTQTSTR